MYATLLNDFCKESDSKVSLNTVKDHYTAYTEERIKSLSSTATGDKDRITCEELLNSILKEYDAQRSNEAGYSVIKKEVCRNTNSY